MRTANIQDVKKGIELINQYGVWGVIGLENNFDNVWIIRGGSGCKLLFEHEVQYYNIKDNE